MQWTPELNDLLNQCVFASGYDFEVSSELFCQQATKLRLWSGDVDLELTANQIQEQWMTLNPTEDDDEEDNVEGPETSSDESRQHDSVDAGVEEDGYVVVPDGGPQLELSLSDAELDQLLSELPSSEEPEGVCTSSSADAKANRSEMQWVLAFLTDPDAIATVDVEAKNLMRSSEKNDDDNYQVFLQDLHDANLMAPAPISAVERHTHHQEAGEGSVRDADESEENSSSDEEDWERTRQAIK
ncbi:hypothetical protein PHPALM_27498, partial [Phytophthora palmivora]